MRARSLPTAVVGVTIAIIAIVTPAARIGAATAACTNTSGVTVVVDFAAFHHGIARGCASGRPTTALAAMQAAGFETAGTTQYGDAFLCRIDDLPSPAAEACASTPSAKSSWSFYWAHPTDAAWTYSRVGVLSYRPQAGSIIAFAFGNLAKPGVAPSAVSFKAAPTTTPTTTAPPPPTPPVAAAAVTTTTPPARPTPTPTLPRAAPLRATTSTDATTSTTAAATRVVDRPPITHVTIKPSSGSPLGAIVAAVIVAGIGVAAGLTIRARRRRTT